MEHTRVWPDRHAELSFAGTIPFALNGLFTWTDSHGQLVHGVRLGHGRPLWYSVLPQDALPSSHTTWRGKHGNGEVNALCRFQNIPGRVRSLTARMTSESAIEWRLADERCEGLQLGTVATEHPKDICDLSLTPSHLVFVAHNRDRDDGVRGLSVPRVGIAQRGLRARIRWFNFESQGIPSILHAHETHDRLVIDVHLHNQAADELTRLTIDAEQGTLQKAALHAGPLRFPTIDPWLGDAPCRFVFALAPDAQQPANTSLVRIDTRTGAAQRRDFGFGRNVGAPTVVRARGTKEDGGYVALTVYDAVRDARNLVLLAPDHISQTPLATVRLPACGPAERAGTWICFEAAKQQSESLAALF